MFGGVSLQSQLVTHVLFDILLQLPYCYSPPDIRLDSLPFKCKGTPVNGYGRLKRMSIQCLRWKATIITWSVLEFQWTSVKSFFITGVSSTYLRDKILHFLDEGLGMAI